MAELINHFISWRNSLSRSIRGGKVMFDVHGHYKWMDESEILAFYLKNYNQ